MESALSDVSYGNTIKGTARKYGMPEGLIRHRIKRMSSVQKSRTPGRPTALAYDEEAQLANYITTMCTPG